MIEISHGKPSEFYEVIDFIDYVFSKNSNPHDFINMYPNLYRPEEEHMQNLLNLREDGVIKASILCLPRTLCVGSHELKVYGVGSVACHPRERGRGFMSMLLKQNNEEMMKAGVHLSNLGGKRSRYNHFGYEIGGNSYETSVSGDAVKRAFPAMDGTDFVFTEFTKDDVQLIDALKEIYDAQPFRYKYTRDDFFLRLIIPSSGAVPYAVSTPEGELLGYIAVDPGREDRVRELCLKDNSVFSEVLFNYCVLFGKGISIELGEWQLPFARALFDIGNEISLDGCGMWKVMDFPAVIKALLSFKASYTHIETGTLVLDIGDIGRTAVTFDGENVTVAQNSVLAPHAVLPGLSAVRALLGPVPAATLGLSLEPRAAALVRSWFPLPLPWFGTERV